MLILYFIFLALYFFLALLLTDWRNRWLGYWSKLFNFVCKLVFNLMVELVACSFILFVVDQLFNYYAILPLGEAAPNSSFDQFSRFVFRLCLQNIPYVLLAPIAPRVREFYLTYPEEAPRRR